MKKTHMNLWMGSSHQTNRTRYLLSFYNNKKITLVLPCISYCCTICNEKHTLEIVRKMHYDCPPAFSAVFFFSIILISYCIYIAMNRIFCLCIQPIVGMRNRWQANIVQMNRIRSEPRIRIVCDQNNWPNLGTDPFLLVYMYMLIIWWFSTWKRISFGALQSYSCFGYMQCRDVWYALD